jgi:hypothetical protein
LQVNLQARQNLNREEKKLTVNLSPVYHQWKAETLKEGERRAIEGLLIVRFGQLDEELAQIIPNLVALNPVDRAKLILDFSRIELIKQFRR